MSECNDDEIFTFMDNNKSTDAKCNENNNNTEHFYQGRKGLIGGLSEETFFSSSHTLKSFADYIAELLTEKKFKHVLPRHMSNVPIEMQFSMNRFLSRNHLTLGICGFYCGKRTLLLQLTRNLRASKDSSLSRVKHKSFSLTFKLLK